MRRAKVLVVLAAALVCLGCTEDRARSDDSAAAAELTVHMCQGTDRLGGRNLLLISMIGDRVSSVSYRRSGDLLVCEIEAFRGASSSPRKHSEWVYQDARSDIFVRRDDLEVAHMQVVRRGRLFEIRMVDYDQSEFCGTGREFLPSITIDPGNPACRFGR